MYLLGHGGERSWDGRRCECWGAPPRDGGGCGSARGFRGRCRRERPRRPRARWAPWPGRPGPRALCCGRRGRRRGPRDRRRLEGQAASARSKLAKKSYPRRRLWTRGRKGRSKPRWVSATRSRRIVGSDIGVVPSRQSDRRTRRSLRCQHPTICVSIPPTGGEVQSSQSFVCQRVKKPRSDLSYVVFGGIMHGRAAGATHANIRTSFATCESRVDTSQ